MAKLTHTTPGGILRHRPRPNRADARLLELVARFKRLRHQLDVLEYREDRCADWQAEGPGIRAATTALVSQCWKICDTVTALPAHTAAGLAAKAELAAWEFCDPAEHADVAVSWSLARDVLALAGRAVA